MNAILKKITFLLASAALITGFTACQDDEPESVSSSQQKIVLAQDEAHTNLEIRSNTAWTAQCIGMDANGAAAPESWFMITPAKGLGTLQVALDVLSANHTSKSRKGKIVVTYAGGQTHTIDVEQRGLTDIESYVTPEQIGVGAKTSTANAFTVSVANRDAVITVTPDPKAAWMKNLKKAYDTSYGYSRKETWAFDADENQNSDARQAVVAVTVKFGYNTYKYTVTVTQDGLGAPAIKTAPTVYLNCAETQHEQPLWLEGGDKTNVQYDVTWTSAHQGVGNDKGWITGARIDAANHKLIVETVANTDEASREGSVLIVAKRASHVGEAAHSTLSVKIVQTGHKSAGIVVPVAETAHPYTAAAYAQQIVLLNNSTVKNISTNNDAMFTAAPVVAEGKLSYSLTAYDGSQGDYREGIITMVVSNGNSNDAVAALTVRQYAPAMPAISMPTSLISCGYAAKTDAQLPLNALNTTRLRVINTSETWLTTQAIGADGILKYSVQAYNGSEGEYREGVITLEASNDHADAAFYYITVRQYAPDFSDITLPQYIGIGHAAQTISIPLNPMAGAFEVVETPAWITSPAIANDTFTALATAYTGGAAVDYKREGVITFKYTRGGKAIYLYVSVCQYGRDMASVTPTSFNVRVLVTPGSAGRYGVGPLTVTNTPKGDVSVVWTETSGTLLNYSTAVWTNPLKFSVTKIDDYHFNVDHGFTWATAYDPEAPYAADPTKQNKDVYGNPPTNKASITVTVNAYPYIQQMTVPCSSYLSN